KWRRGGLWRGALLLLAYAPQVLIRAQEDLAVGDRRRCVCRFTRFEAVGRQQLVLRAGGEYKRAGVARHDVGVAGGVGHGTPVFFGGAAVCLPDLLAGGQLVAVGRAVFFEDVDVVPDDDAGADALDVFGVMPEAVFGDVAGAADFDGEGGFVETGHGDGDL